MKTETNIEVEQAAVSGHSLHMGSSNFAGSDRPTWDLYATCVHCGLCLNHCPTYRVLGMEMDSPRGRIYQVLQVDSGRLAIGDSFVTHIDRCLDCRACETACPSGVQYGHIVERARAQIEQHYKRPWLARQVRTFFYRHVLGNSRRLSIVAKLLRFYQRSGLQTVARSSGLLRLVGMAKLEQLQPKIDDRFFFDQIGKVFPADGERRATVALHAGCIASVAFSALNEATIRVLTKNGVEVWVPGNQNCCGALQAHAGYREEARKLARENIAAMLDDRFDAIVTNAAGCGSTLKEYGDLLREDEQHEQAQKFARKVKDVTEFLEELGLRPPTRKLEVRATYQDPCHLAHGQRIRNAPRQLLCAVGLELEEMPHADQCCGSAGSYNVTQNDLSMKILDAKMNDIASTSAELVVTANVGCMLQLRAGMERSGRSLSVKHVIEVLDACF
ncbi:MAG TPA: heterodisulfide reductase-related iron-sulfur binding cluster [Terriglobales bacterium]|nr:heterodisulfide reductase-related iron-sulfur binding cluster [Terriglobales bacterium]